jgi:flagellar basal-body rod modification protein FlgD
VVYEGEMDLTKGDNEFKWDGKLANGQEAPEGPYQISIAATDEDGAAVAITTRVTGTVTGVDTSGTEPYLKIGNTSVPLYALRKILG